MGSREATCTREGNESEKLVGSAVMAPHNAICRRGGPNKMNCSMTKSSGYRWVEKIQRRFLEHVWHAKLREVVRRCQKHGDNRFACSNQI